MLQDAASRKVRAKPNKLEQSPAVGLSIDDLESLASQPAVAKLLSFQSRYISKSYSSFASHAGQGALPSADQRRGQPLRGGGFCKILCGERGSSRFC